MPMGHSWFTEVIESGVIRLSGADRINFLQRQSTNDLQKLTSGHSIQTVLTSPTGRILDVLQVFLAGDDLLVLTLAYRRMQTFKFLQSRIFFMDKVDIKDDSVDFLQYFVFGKDAIEVIEKFGTPLPGTGTAINLPFSGQELTAIHQTGILWSGIRLLVPRRIGSQVSDHLANSGALALTPEEIEIFRIEAGIPGPQSELTEDYTPLEVDLKELISENKGCYTGQEVLARQMTYQKIARQLTGLRLGAEIQPGSKLYSGPEPVGFLTSSAVSPRYGTIGLAIIKTGFIQPGTQLEVRADNQKTTGVVVNLPFSS